MCSAAVLSLKFADNRRPSILIGGADSAKLNTLAAELTIKGAKIFTVTDSVGFIEFAITRWNQGDPFHLLVVVDSFAELPLANEASLLRTRGYPFSIMAISKKVKDELSDGFLMYDAAVSEFSDSNFYLIAKACCELSNETIEGCFSGDKSHILNAQHQDCLQALDAALGNGDMTRIKSAYQEFASILPLESHYAQIMLRKVHASITTQYFQLAREYLHVLRQ